MDAPKCQYCGKREWRHVCGVPLDLREIAKKIPPPTKFKNVVTQVVKADASAEKFEVSEADEVSFTKVAEVDFTKLTQPGKLEHLHGEAFVLPEDRPASKMGNEVNIKDWGAAQDAMTDDSSALAGATNERKGVDSNRAGVGKEPSDLASWPEAKEAPKAEGAFKVNLKTFKKVGRPVIIQDRKLHRRQYMREWRAARKVHK